MANKLTLFLIDRSGQKAMVSVQKRIPAPYTLSASLHNMKSVVQLNLSLDLFSNLKRTDSHENSHR